MSPAVLVTGSYGVGLISSVGVTVVAGRVLPSDEVGTFFVILTTAAAVALVFDGGAGRLALRDLARTGPTGAVLSLARPAFGQSLLAALAIAAATVITGLSGAWVPVGILAAAEAVRAITSDAARGLDDYWAFAVLSRGVVNLVFLTVAIGLLVTGSGTASAALLLWLLIISYGAVLIGAMLARSSVRLVVTQLWERPVSAGLLPLWRSGWPFVANRLTALLSNSVDIWIAAAFLDPLEVGLYAGVSRTVNMVSAPLILVNQTIAPRISRSLGPRGAGEAETLARHSASRAVLASALLAAPFIFTPEEVMRVVLGSTFATGAAAVAIPLGIGRLVSVGLGPSGTAVAMGGEERRGFRAAVVGLAVTAALGLTAGLAAPVLWAVAGASAVGTVAQNVMMWAEARWRLGIRTHAHLPLAGRRSESAPPLLHAAFVLATDGVGGSEVATARLARAMQVAGHHIEVWVVRSVSPSVRRRFPEVTFRNLGGRRAATAWIHVRRAIRHLGPRVVVSVGGTIAPSCWVATTATQARHVSVIHNTWSTRAAGTLRGRLARAVLACVVYPTTPLVAISEGMRRDLLASMPHMSPGSVRVIPNIVEVGAPSHLGRRRSDRVPMLGFVGSLTQVKRPLLFLELIEVCHARGLLVRGVMAGTGPLANQVHEKVRGRGLPVALLGAVDHPEEIYTEIDVLTITSSSEGMPNVAVEAAMMDCGVVATRCSDELTEFLATLPRGATAQGEGPAALADAVAAVLNGSKSPVGRSRALAPYTRSRVVPQWQAIIGDEVDR